MNLENGLSHGGKVALKKGASYTKLFQELQNDPAAFKAKFRVTPAIFEFILKLVSPLISRMDTHFRESIPAG